MSRAPAFQLYAGDFFIDTLEWSLEEVGAYTRLLLYEWDNGSLPTDIKKLSQVAGTTPKRFQKVSKTVLAKFTMTDQNRFINERLERTRQEQENYRKSQSESGKRGAEKRWKKHGKPNGNPISKPNGNPNGEKIALQSPIKKNTKKKVSFCIPDSFTLSSKHIEYAVSKGISEQDIQGIFDEFKNWHQAKGTKYVDWDAVWRTWVGKHLEYHPKKPSPYIGGWK